MDNDPTTCTNIQGKASGLVVDDDNNIIDECYCSKGKRRGYIKDLVAFVQKYKFDQVMVLTSADASLRTDAQITSVPFRVIATNEATLQKAQDIGIPRLDTDEKDVHGTGMGLSFYNALKEASINATMMIMFALEGGKFIKRSNG